MPTDQFDHNTIDALASAVNVIKYDIDAENGVSESKALADISAYYIIQEKNRGYAILASEIPQDIYVNGGVANQNVDDSNVDF